MILIIGSSGFIGSRLYQTLKTRKIPVIGTFFSKPLTDQSDTIYFDLNQPDFNKILAINNLKYVVFCHGLSDTKFCQQNKKLSSLINVHNTVQLLTLLKSKNITPIYLSTSMVYNGEKKEQKETDQPQPLLEYGKQKLLVEQFIQKAFSNFTILRLTKVFGIEENDKTLFTSWFNQLKLGQEIKAVSDIFISPLFIEDLNTVLVQCLEKGLYGTYNFGGPKVLSFYQLALLLANILKLDTALIKKISFQDLPLKEKYPKYNSVDFTKLKKALKLNLFAYEDCLKKIKKATQATVMN